VGIESPVHLIFIAAVALIVLGPKRLPRLARALGQGIREFRGAIEQGDSPPTEPPEPVEPAALPTEPPSADTTPVPVQPVVPAPHPEGGQPVLGQPHAAVAEESADPPAPSGQGGSA
jgi:sec-independent protein translocase protein TatA